MGEKRFSLVDVTGLVLLVLGVWTVVILAVVYNEKPIPQQVTTPVGLMIKPEHRVILAKAGWLGFVLKNIDKLTYYPYEAMVNGHEDALGVADVQNGETIAVIATKNRDDLSVCATIVHEATHLNGYKIGGYYASQQDAENNESKFLTDYVNKAGPTIVYINWAYTSGRLPK